MPPVILIMVAVEEATTAAAAVAAAEEEAVDMAEDIMDAEVTRMEEVDTITTIITMVGTGITMTGK